jgi:lysophospholipase L1-like esterase
MPEYLALGDSYTIGEGVEAEASFPHQLHQLLNAAGLAFGKPVIMAKTGWTTGELLEAINKTPLTTTFDLVTLLIGVNNQYRSLSIEEYETEFTHLLELAINFAGGNRSAVYVVSIPDWSATPFAVDRDREKISHEIDSFNEVNMRVSVEYKTNYVAITEGSRAAIHDTSLVTSDKLHPSPKEYARWAKKLAERITTSSIYQI